MIIGNSISSCSPTNKLTEDVPEFKSNKVKEKRTIIWSNVLIFTYIHLAAIYGTYLAFTSSKWQTLLFATILYILGKFGMTAGVHRLWSHRAYKANAKLRFLLMIFFTMAFEGTIYSWARDHRVHHKYQDTNADPYNIKLGFWYAHLGWLLQSKHPDVVTKGQGLDVSDLLKDKIVMFQLKYYWILILLLVVIMSTLVPFYFWAESFSTAWHVAFCLRCCLSQHGTWTINSFAHIYGNRPYDASFFARENDGVTLATLGEGWHNYHHSFPWDYRASEMYAHNLSTAFIDLMAKFGWAYDLRTASPAIIKKRALRTGDGTYEDVWGWNDADMSQNDKEEVVRYNNETNANGNL